DSHCSSNFVDARNAASFAHQALGFAYGAWSSQRVRPVDLIAVIVRGQVQQQRKHEFIERLGRLRWQLDACRFVSQCESCRRLPGRLEFAGEWAKNEPKWLVKWMGQPARAKSLEQSDIDPDGPLSKVRREFELTRHARRHGKCLPAAPGSFGSGLSCSGRTAGARHHQ